ncbi:MAG TPA: class I SAM-dependent methyltransferase [Kiritimatiellia bacterium]|nr:class I SAM-dependent methyltransferase [Kiritimatiellia bacterium]
MNQSGEGRFAHEREHGRFLASEGAENVWGWGSPAGQVRSRRRAHLISEGARLGPGANVLEVGCGTGLFTEIFAATGAAIMAVDISEELLELARRRGLPPHQVRFIAKPFEECEVDGPFHAVLGSSILHHLNMEQSLPKLFRLLKPGGWFSFAEPNMLNPQIALQKNIPWLKARLGDSPDETAFIRWRLASELRRHGFDEVTITPFDWLHPAIPAPLIGTVSAIGRLFECLPLIREISGSLLIVARRPL